MEIECTKLPMPLRQFMEVSSMDFGRRAKPLKRTLMVPSTFMPYGTNLKTRKSYLEKAYQFGENFDHQTSEVCGLYWLHMPNVINTDLPSALRNYMPEHTRDIFRSAFEHAHEGHKGDPRQEKIAFRAAWAAGSRGYVN